MVQWGESEEITIQEATNLLCQQAQCKNMYVILGILCRHVFRPIMSSSDKPCKENTVPYATEMVGSLLKGPLNHLRINDDPTLGIDVQGVSSSYLYFGLAFVYSYFDLILTGTACSPFCLHHEDKGLCSVNYGHYGAPKVWFGTAQEDYKKVVQLLKKSVFVCLFYSCLQPLQRRLQTLRHGTCSQVILLGQRAYGDVGYQFLPGLALGYDLLHSRPRSSNLWATLCSRFRAPSTRATTREPTSSRPATLLPQDGSNGPLQTILVIIATRTATN